MTTPLISRYVKWPEVVVGTVGASRVGRSVMAVPNGRVLSLAIRSENR